MFTGVHICVCIRQTRAKDTAHTYFVSTPIVNINVHTFYVRYQWNEIHLMQNRMFTAPCAFSRKKNNRFQDIYM